MKLKTKIIIVVTGLISMSWSLMLSYQILQLVGATELMWFLFWTNIPMIIIVNILGRMMEK